MWRAQADEVADVSVAAYRHTAVLAGDTTVCASQH